MYVIDFMDQHDQLTLKSHVSEILSSVQDTIQEFHKHVIEPSIENTYSPNNNTNSILKEKR